eukprot:7591238-Pyramimonas_sp.AAC.1
MRQTSPLRRFGPHGPGVSGAGASALADLLHRRARAQAQCMIWPSVRASLGAGMSPLSAFCGRVAARAFGR